MSMLLSENFYWLLKNKVFWITVCLTGFFQAAMVYDRYHINKLSEFETYTLNDAVFEFLPFLGFVFAVFITLFLGRENSDGTIRNKIIAGHKRECVYLSNFIICIVGITVMYGVYTVVGFIGVPLLGKWQGGAENYILYVLAGLFICAAFAAIFTMISMLVTNVPIAVVLSVIVALVMVFFSSMIYQQLCQAEFTREFIKMSASGAEYGPEIPNPAYVSGVRRQVYAFLGEFLPSGQGILAANGELTKPFVNIAYSALLTAGINLAGIFAFKRKDLK